MIFLYLFLTFFEIGLFSFGGEYAMLPLVQNEVVVNHQWLTSAEFANVVGLSQVVPGSIGINSATYCGYVATQRAGYGFGMSVLGSLIATIAVLLPLIILVTLTVKMFIRYIGTTTLQNVSSGIRPAVVGLLAATVIMLFNANSFGSTTINLWQFSISVALFVASFIGVKVVGINPVRMICYAAISGLLLLY